jgi:hypothetical protein
MLKAKTRIENTKEIAKNTTRYRNYPMPNTLDVPHIHRQPDCGSHENSHGLSLNPTTSTQASKSARMRYIKAAAKEQWRKIWSKDIKTIKTLGRLQGREDSTGRKLSTLAEIYGV